MNLRFSPPVDGIIGSIGSLFGMGKGKDATDKDAVDIDKDGRTLYKEDIIKDILEDLEKRKTERSAIEQQWTLNANFLVGNQYCEVNPYRGTELPRSLPRRAF